MTGPLSDLVAALDDLQTTFHSELAMLQEAQRRLHAVAAAPDEAARADAMTDVRRALRLLRKTNSEVRRFVDAALEVAGGGE